jgi:hypothetical protein
MSKPRQQQLSGCGQQFPVATRHKAQNNSYRQQGSHDYPFETAIMVIWIPASQSLDPVMPEYG